MTSGLRTKAQVSTVCQNGEPESGQETLLLHLREVIAKWVEEQGSLSLTLDSQGSLSIHFPYLEQIPVTGKVQAFLSGLGGELIRKQVYIEKLGGWFDL